MLLKTGGGGELEESKEGGNGSHALPLYFVRQNQRALASVLSRFFMTILFYGSLQKNKKKKKKKNKWNKKTAVVLLSADIERFE